MDTTSVDELRDRLLYLARRIDAERNDEQNLTSLWFANYSRGSDEDHLRRLVEGADEAREQRASRADEIRSIAASAPHEARAMLYEAAVHVEVGVKSVLKELCQAAALFHPNVEPTHSFVMSQPMSVAEIAKKFNRHRNTVTRWIKAGALPSERVRRGTYRIRSDWVPND